MTKKALKSPLSFFFIISILGIISFFIYAYLVGNKAFYWVSMENDPTIGSIDYFMHVYFAADPAHLYDRATGEAGCFPPLIYFMYSFFARILSANTNLPEGILLLEQYDYAGTVYMYYSMLTGVTMLLAIMAMGRRSVKRAIALFLVLILSAPFYTGGFAQGNSAMIVLNLLLIFFSLYDSEVRWQRRLAVVILALCAAIKIYPAVFGLLYLKDKRYKEAAELVGLAIILFCFPFAFFGGMEGVVKWLGHIKYTSNYINYGRVQYIAGVAYMFFKHFMDDPIQISKICATIFMLVMILLAALTKSRFRTIFYLTALMVFYPTNSFRYTLGYMAIPLILWIMYECDKENVDNDHRNSMNMLKNDHSLSCGYTVVIMILNGLLFSLPTWWGIITGFRMNFGYETFTYVELYLYGVAYLLLAVVMVHGIYTRMKRR